MMKHLRIFYVLLVFTVALPWLPGMQRESEAMQIIPIITLPNTSSAFYDMIRCMAPDPSIYGIAVGTVYCIKKYMNIAATLYVTYLTDSTNHLVTGYQVALYILVLAIFGVRVMTQRTESIMKESMALLIKLAISVFLVMNSSQLFNTLSNVMGELIGITYSIFSIAAPTQACIMLDPLKLLLETVDPAVGAPGGYAEYEVWHQIDCILMRMFGTTVSTPSLATLQGALTALGIPVVLPAFPSIPMVTQASMVPIVMAALSTNTIGIAVFALGIAVFMKVIKAFMKAMFLVLIAYMILAIACIFAPLVAPLIVVQHWNNEAYTKQIFDRWVNLIICTVLQPPIMVAFVGFLAMAVDSFIQGDISNDPGIRAVYSTCTRGEPLGGLCSFNQLFKTATQIAAELVTTPENAALVTMNGDYTYMTDPHPVIANWRVEGDPLTAGNNCQVINRNLSFIPQPVVVEANQMTSKAVGVVIMGPERLKMTDFMFLLQFVLLLIVALFLLHILVQMLEMIPAMIASIVGQPGFAIDIGPSGIESLMNKGQKGLLGGTKGSRKKPDSFKGPPAGTRI